MTAHAMPGARGQGGACDKQQATKSTGAVFISDASKRSNREQSESRELAESESRREPREIKFKI